MTMTAARAARDCNDAVGLVVAARHCMLETGDPLGAVVRLREAATFLRRAALHLAREATASARSGIGAGKTPARAGKPAPASGG